MLKVPVIEPDLPTRVRQSARDARQRVQQRIRRLRDAGMDHRAPVAEAVTGGPDLVGNLVLIYNIATGRIEYAARGALKS